MKGIDRLIWAGLVLSLALGGCDKSEERTETDTPADVERKAHAPGDTAAMVADWCAGHGLPESKCTKCNPELVAKFKAAGDWCAEHGFPESACPTCNPVPRPGATPDSSSIDAGTRIRFRSPEIESAAGIGVATARETDMDVGVECTARIDFDQNRVADIRASIPGVVREVLVDLGARTKTGTPLFVLESSTVGDLQARVRTARERVEVARADFERQKDLHSSQIASKRQVELSKQELDAAESEFRAVEASLRIAGASSENQEGRYTLASPIAGTVVRRPATVGVFATDETSLATVADTRVMWALLDVAELDAILVKVGQPVTIHVEGLADKLFEGKVTWIASEVDAKTRTIAARAEVGNPDGVLRAHQFVRATIQAASPEGAVTVPRASVQRLGEQFVVFVRTGTGLYEPRPVQPGRQSGTLVHVSGNVRAGDAVVTDGAFLLKTEMSKESIGGGCCEVEQKVAEQ